MEGTTGKMGVKRRHEGKGGKERSQKGDTPEKLVFCALWPCSARPLLSL